MTNFEHWRNGLTVEEFARVDDDRCCCDCPVWSKCHSIDGAMSCVELRKQWANSPYEGSNVSISPGTMFKLSQQEHAVEQIDEDGVMIGISREWYEKAKVRLAAYEATNYSPEAIVQLLRQSPNRGDGE